MLNYAPLDKRLKDDAHSITTAHLPFSYTPKKDVGGASVPAMKVAMQLTLFNESVTATSEKRSANYNAYE